MSNTTDNQLFSFGCESCGKALMCRPCMDVDGARDQVVRELLMAGKLNVYECECGHQGETPIPVLYRNSRLNFVVAYVPPHLIERREYVELFTPSAQPARRAGLGLSVVEQILRNHSGHVEVASQQGKGSQLTLLWPSASQPPAPSPSSSSNTNPNPRSQDGLGPNPGR